MKVGKAIYSAITGDGTLAGLVSTRVYPDRAVQQATLPYIIYTAIDTQPTDTKDGASALDIVRVQVDTFASTYDSANTISERVRTVLDRKTGTVGTLSIDSMHFVNEISSPPDLEQHIFMVSQEYNVRLKR